MNMHIQSCRRKNHIIYGFPTLSNWFVWLIQPDGLLDLFIVATGLCVNFAIDSISGPLEVAFARTWKIVRPLVVFIILGHVCWYISP